MITSDYARLMARYNRWRNGAIFAEAGTLSEAERARDRGGFFGSIQGTLNHVLWADRLWLHRFAETGAPNTANISFKRPKERPHRQCYFLPYFWSVL